MTDDTNSLGSIIPAMFLQKQKQWMGIEEAEHCLLRKVFCFPSFVSYLDYTTELSPSSQSIKMNEDILGVPPDKFSARLSVKWTTSS